MILNNDEIISNYDIVTTGNKGINILASASADREECYFIQFTE